MASPAELIPKVIEYVKQYMSKFDGSHDFQHIERVVALSHLIYDELQNPFQSRSNSSNNPAYLVTSSAPKKLLDRDIITLTALLHDVGDRKYLKAGEDSQTMVLGVLLSLGAPYDLAVTIQNICSGVSFTNEMQNPSIVTGLIAKYPELAVVQDADRLDALGAVGIGRVFAYGGAKTDRGLGESIGLFERKLEKMEKMMKTAPGQRMGRERTHRLKKFRGWWEAEAEIVRKGVQWL